MTGVICVIPYIPRFETVNVAPDSSGGVMVWSRTRWARRRASAAISRSGRLSASGIVGTTSAPGAATAIPTLTWGCSSNWPSR